MIGAVASRLDKKAKKTANCGLFLFYQLTGEPVKYVNHF